MLDISERQMEGQPEEGNVVGGRKVEAIFVSDREVVPGYPLDNNELNIG